MIDKMTKDPAQRQAEKAFPSPPRARPGRARAAARRSTRDDHVRRRAAFTPRVTVASLLLRDGVSEKGFLPKCVFYELTIRSMQL